MKTTVFSARTVFLFAGIVAGATVSRTARDAVAFLMTVFMVSGTRARRLALLALAFTGATIGCARAVFLVVGIVASATVVAIRFVATGFFVLMVSVGFAGEVRAAFAVMQTAVIAASASFVEYMAITIVGRFTAFGAAPLTANALATTTRAALTI